MKKQIFSKKLIIMIYQVINKNYLINTKNHAILLSILVIKNTKKRNKKRKKNKKIKEIIQKKISKKKIK